MELGAQLLQTEEGVPVPLPPARPLDGTNHTTQALHVTPGKECCDSFCSAKKQHLIDYPDYAFESDWLAHDRPCLSPLCCDELG